MKTKRKPFKAYWRGRSFTVAEPIPAAPEEIRRDPWFFWTVEQKDGDGWTILKHLDRCIFDAALDWVETYGPVARKCRVIPRPVLR